MEINMKIHRRKHTSGDVLMILIAAFSLMISSVLCDSHLYQPHEIEVQHNSHLPLQPELVRIFENCHKKSGTFDLCVKNAFNELRVYFNTGEFTTPFCWEIMVKMVVLSYKESLNETENEWVVQKCRKIEIKWNIFPTIQKIKNQNSNYTL